MEEALAFAAEGKVKATVETHQLDSINEIFERLKNGRVNGRVVLAIGDHASAQGARPFRDDTDAVKSDESVDPIHVSRRKTPNFVKCRPAKA